MKEKIIWIDVLRVLAMFLVVVGHGIYTSGDTFFGEYGFENESGEYSFSYRIISVLVAFIYSFHMPLFMACSGACFSFAFGKKSIKEVVLSKVKRLLVPFFYTALLLSIPVRIAIGYYEVHDNNLLYAFAHHFVFPIEIHLWFLLSLFLIFPLFCLIYPLHKRSKLLFWAVLVLLSYWGNVNTYPLSGFLGIPMALKHLLWFSVGFFAFKSLKNHNPKWQILIGSIILQFCGFMIWVKFLEPMGHSYWFCLILALWGCYNTAALCILLSRFPAIINSKAYNTLLKYNFQIYLYSDPFNYIFLIGLFSIGAIDFFGNSVHTAIVTVLRITVGIVFGILIAKLVEHLPKISECLPKNILNKKAS